MKVNEIQQQMRKRWDEKGWNYDLSSAHGIHNQDEKKQWAEQFKQCQDGALEVLDVGTGTGFVALLAAELGHKVTAIDWSNTMLTQAKAKAKNENYNIHFIEGITESLPFENNRFDVVTARHVLWTLSDPDQALAEWYRVLTPGGKVCADYSPRNEEHKSHHYIDEVENRLPLNKNISAEIIKGLFSKAGFIDVQASMKNKGSEDHYHRITYMLLGIKPLN